MCTCAYRDEQISSFKSPDRIGNDFELAKGQTTVYFVALLSKCTYYCFQLYIIGD